MNFISLHATSLLFVLRIHSDFDHEVRQRQPPLAGKPFVERSDHARDLPPSSTQPCQQFGHFFCFPLSGFCIIM
jgi:hypothetical protein